MQTNDNCPGSTLILSPGPRNPSLGRGIVTRIFKVASPRPNPFPRLSPTSNPVEVLLGIHCIAMITVSIDRHRLPLSLCSAMWISRSAKMKAIFIGFCSDFKWICGSILNAQVRQPSLRIGFRLSLRFSVCGCGVSAVISLLFKFVCLFLSLCVIMRIFQLSSASRGRRRRHTWPTAALECFRQFGACNYGLWFHF